MSGRETINAPSLAGWAIAAAAGVVAFGVSLVALRLGTMQAAFIAAVVFVVVGLILGLPWGSAPAVDAARAAHPVAPADLSRAEAPVGAAPDAVARDVAAAEPATAAPMAAAPMAAMEAPASAAPMAAMEAPASAAPMAAMKAPASAAPTAAMEAPASAAPMAAMEAPASADPVGEVAAMAAPAASAASPATSGVASRPAGLTAARAGGADDLKRIKGIGPKLELLCNTLGFYHFDQIANWTADEIAWVDDNLEGFKGRVTRDNWVAQARILAAGGTTEFAARVDKGEVY